MLFVLEHPFGSFCANNLSNLGGLLSLLLGCLDLGPPLTLGGKNGFALVRRRLALLLGETLELTLLVDVLYIRLTTRNKLRCKRKALSLSLALSLCLSLILRMLYPRDSRYVPPRMVFP